MNVVEAPAQSLVVDEGAVHIVAMNTPFIAKDHFVLGEGDAIRIAFMARNFERMFLEKEEENFQGSTLKYGGLVQKCVDPWILKSLGGEEVAGISLAEFFSLLANPKDLHRDGKMNLCFIPDVSNTLRTVGVYQVNSGFCLCATPLSPIDQQRPKGCRVFYPYNVSV